MKLFATTALVCLALSAAAVAQAQTQTSPAAAAQSPPQPKPSPKAAKALFELNDAVAKKDWANVPAKVAAAQAVASTKDDRYIIANDELKAAIAQNDTAAMSSAVDAIVQSGFVDAKKTEQLYLALGGTYAKAKEYPQAAAVFQKAVTIDPANADAFEYLGEAQGLGGQNAEAAASFQRSIQIRSAVGQKPEESLLKNAIAAAYKAKLPISVDLARQWVAAYPSPSSWSDAVAIYMNLDNPDSEARVDLYRLLEVAGAMNSGAKYDQYAISAADLNNYNEAQAAIDAGLAAKQLNPSDASDREVIDAVKTKPKATAADLAEATKNAVNGMALLRIGDRYYSMGDYSKAVQLYHMARGKPGVDPALADLHIGMALTRAGDKAGATSALKAVTGPRADIAKFWLLYLGQQA